MSYVGELLQSFTVKHLPADNQAMASHPEAAVFDGALSQASLDAAN